MEWHDTGDKSIGDIVTETQSKIDQIAVDNNWGTNQQGNCDDEQNDGSELCLRMTLTGPAPLTNAVTEESFNLFWKVFPMGVVYVAIGLFYSTAIYFRPVEYDGSGYQGLDYIRPSHSVRCLDNTRDDRFSRL